MVSSMPENERDGVYGNVKIGDNACVMPNSTITPGDKSKKAAF